MIIELIINVFVQMYIDLILLNNEFFQENFLWILYKRHVNRNWDLVIKRKSIFDK